jgi:organic hydroperoxide reductase OsmC/OhrA
MSAKKAKKAETSAGDERAHLVTIDWERGKWSGAMDQYPRKHRWHFAGQLVLEVSEVPGIGYQDEVRLDPWSSYVATIASGHMLAWLHAAFSHGVQVESYVDRAEGVLSQLPEGRNWVSQVILHPQVTFRAGQQVTEAQRTHFHELAYRDCFIAASVKTKVTIAIAPDKAAP